MFDFMRGSGPHSPSTAVRHALAARTSERGLNIRAYKDLSAYPKLVLRTGHVEEDGGVVINRPVRSVDAAIPVRAPADRAAHADDERFVFPETFRREAR